MTIENRGCTAGREHLLYQIVSLGDMQNIVIVTVCAGQTKKEINHIKMQSGSTNIDNIVAM